MIFIDCPWMFLTCDSCLYRALWIAFVLEGGSRSKLALSLYWDRSSHILFVCLTLSDFRLAWILYTSMWTLFDLFNLINVGVSSWTNISFTLWAHVLSHEVLPHRNPIWLQSDHSRPSTFACQCRQFSFFKNKQTSHTKVLGQYCCISLLNLYHTFIQSTLQYCLTFRHTLAHRRRCEGARRRWD